MKFIILIVGILALAELAEAQDSAEAKHFIQLSAREAIDYSSTEEESSFTEDWWKSASDYFYSVVTPASDDYSLPLIERQIFRQLGPLTLLDLAPLSREELIDKLQADFNISIAVDDPTLFNKYMLSYLYLWFEMMLPAEEVQDKAYNLYALKNKSPVLVRRQGSDIYFSKTAGITTITYKFNEVIEHFFKNRTFTSGENISITFDYSNELFQELNKALLNSKHIKDFITAKTGVLFGVHSKDPFYPKTKEFTFEELLKILKQFLDLPEHIRTRLSLKRLVRVMQGEQVSLQPFSAASYRPDTQMIKISEEAFNETSSYGEGIILHELGHALWFGLPREIQKEYEKLSWGEGVSGNFVSKYSTGSVEEDFAEHFMAYIDNSERLKNKVKEKYDWLKEYIFFNTEYFSSVPENLKIFLESDLEDITAPVWGAEGELNISLQPEEGEEGPLFLTGEISNIFDDVSGVKKITIIMELSSGAKFVEGADRPLNGYISITAGRLGEKDECDTVIPCVYQEAGRPGWYLIKRKIYRDRAYKGLYRVIDVKVEDYAGNERWFNFRQGGEKSIFFPGTKKPIKKEEKQKQKLLSEKNKRDIKDKTLLKASTIDQGTLVTLFFPDIEKWDSISDIRVYLVGEETQKDLTYVVDMSDLPYLRSTFDIAETLGYVSFPFIVPKQLKSQKYVVERISFISAPDSNSYFEEHVYTAIDFNHFSSWEDQTIPRAVVENIDLTSRYEKNQKQQDTAVITAKIPIEGFETENGSYSIYLRTPQGEHLILADSGSVKEIFKTDPEGSLYLEASFSLDPYYAEGEYILSDLYLYEFYDSNIPPEMNINGNHQKYYDYFVERNIRKTIKITIPEYSPIERD